MPLVRSDKAAGIATITIDRGNKASNRRVEIVVGERM